MTQPQTHGANIAARINELQIAVARAQAAHASRALELVDKPSDAKLQADLQAIENEAADYQRQIARLEVAAAEIERRNGVEARHARYEQVQAALGRIKRTRPKLRQLAQRMLDQIEPLGPLFAEWDALLADQRADAVAIVKSHAADSAEQRLERSAQFFTSCDHALRATAVQETLLAALQRAGLGRSGPDMTGRVELTGQIHQPGPSIDDVFKRADGTLLSALSEELKRRADEFGVVA